MLHYDGTPIVVNDAVGMTKTFSDADRTASSDKITVNDTNFLGFTDLNVGQTITVDGTDYTISSVDSANEVTVGSVSSDATGDAGSVESKRAIYACRFDEVDGIAAVYHQNRGIPANASEHYGPIAGFDAEDQGLLEGSPQYQTRLDFYGQVVVHDYESIARLAGHKLS